MAKYAKIGKVDDVQKYIDSALKCLQMKSQEETLTEEDIRLRQVIHEGRDEFVDLICRAL